MTVYKTVRAPRAIPVKSAGEASSSCTPLPVSLGLNPVALLDHFMFEFFYAFCFLLSCSMRVVFYW